MKRKSNAPVFTFGLHDSRYPLQFVYLEMLEPRLVGLTLSVVFAAVLLFGVAGPLGTAQDLRPIARLAYWGLCAVVCWPICHAHDTVTLYLTRSWHPRIIVLITTAGALSMAIPCAAVIYALRGLFDAGLGTGPTLGEAYLLAAPLSVAVISLLHYVACQRVKLSTAASRPGTVVVRPAPTGVVPAAARTEPATARQAAPVRPATAQPTGRDPPVGALGEAARAAVARQPVPLRAAPTRASDAVTRRQRRFLQRLPSPLNDDIVRLKAVEHYVEVLTTNGTALILKRFADAVDDLGHLGMRVHRSYWVAHRHVTRIVRDKHRTLLRLSNGEEIPVSRTYLSAVRNSVAARPPTTTP
jgi:hypothetical protein